MIKAIGVLIGVLSFSGITLAEEQEIYFVGGIYCVSKAIIGIQDGVPKFEMIGADVICLQVGIAAVSYRDEKLYISTNRKTYVYSAITYKFEY
ncbi:MAG: hypothetical protein OEY67_11140, partial [Gammaproteobacteria bacterium]|nr:hypothetical protein [Gammaproteobacteria bacterium]